MAIGGRGKKIIVVARQQRKQFFRDAGSVVVARQSGWGFDCRARCRPPLALRFLYRCLSSVAVDVHFEDCSVVDEPIYGGNRHGLIGKDFSPFAEGLICGDGQGSSLVAGDDELEQHAGFRLILGDIGEV